MTVLRHLISVLYVLLDCQLHCLFRLVCFFKKVSFRVVMILYSVYTFENRTNTNHDRLAYLLIRQLCNENNLINAIGLDWNTLFCADKIRGKKNHMHKMDNTSYSPYQSIYLIKFNVKNSNNDNNN